MARAKSNPLAQRRLRPADAERYGVEWVDVDKGLDALNDLDYDGLKAVEDQVKAVFGAASLLRYIGVDMASMDLDSERFRLWLGLRAAGVEVPPLAEFKPACFNLEYRPRPADADPPAETSESSPASMETTTPESETSTSGSTPGSPATTA